MTTYITVCEVVLKCVAAILFVMIILLSVLYRRYFVQNCIFMNKYLTFVNISRGFFLDSISCRIEGYLHPSGLLLPIISHRSKTLTVFQDVRLHIEFSGYRSCHSGNQHGRSPVLGCIKLRVTTMNQYLI